MIFEFSETERVKYSSPHFSSSAYHEAVCTSSLPCRGDRGSRCTLVSLARPSHSAAFSTFRINTRREGLARAHCLYPFGSSQPRCWLANQIQGKCDYVTLKFSARMPSRTGTVVGRITYCLGFSFSLKTTTEARFV